MGGVAIGPGERAQFPGVVVILNQGPNTPPSTGGTVGTVVNHIGFTVPNVQEAVAKWKAAGVPFEPGAPGRLDQGWVTTTDGLKIEIQEDKDQKEPIRSKHVHFFLPENAIGARPGTAKSSAPRRACSTMLRLPTSPASSCAGPRPVLRKGRRRAGSSITSVSM
jgi:hypothetical protein